MTWSVHPAKANRKKTVVSLTFIGAFLIFILIFYGALFALLGFLFLFVSLQSYYFSTGYEIDAETVAVRTLFGTQKKKLSEFKRLYTGKNGMLLSPFVRKTFLNHFRGVFLYFPSEPGERAAVAEYVKRVFPAS